MGSDNWGGNDRGPTVQAVTWALAAIVLISVFLRFLSRTCFKGNNLGLDDYITAGCTVVYLANAIAMSLAVQAGMGKHIQDVPLGNISTVTLRILILNSLNTWACSLPKLAIIALLQRLLKLSPWTRAAFWGLGILNQACTVGLTVLWWTRCSPVQANYDPMTPGGVCGSFHPLEIGGYVTASINPVLDMFFALYPLPMVWKLNMDVKKRIGVCLGLGIGVVASAVSIYKLTFIPNVVSELSEDPTWAVVPVDLFTHVESSLLLITASMPAIGPLFRWTRSQISTDRDYKFAGYGSKQFRSKGGAVSVQRNDVGSRTDYIPLVDGRGRQYPTASGDGHLPGDITKTVQISVRHDEC